MLCILNFLSIYRSVGRCAAGTLSSAYTPSMSIVVTNSLSLVLCLINSNYPLASGLQQPASSDSTGYPQNTTAGDRVQFSRLVDPYFIQLHLPLETPRPQQIPEPAATQSGFWLLHLTNCPWVLNKLAATSVAGFNLPPLSPTRAVTLGPRMPPVSADGYLVGCQHPSLPVGD